MASECRVSTGPASVVMSDTPTASAWNFDGMAPAITPIWAMMKENSPSGVTDRPTRSDSRVEPPISSMPVVTATGRVTCTRGRISSMSRPL